MSTKPQSARKTKKPAPRISFRISLADRLAITRQTLAKLESQAKAGDGLAAHKLALYHYLSEHSRMSGNRLFKLLSCSSTGIFDVCDDNPSHRQFKCRKFCYESGLVVALNRNRRYWLCDEPLPGAPLGVFAPAANQQVLCLVCTQTCAGVVSGDLARTGCAAHAIEGEETVAMLRGRDIAEVIEAWHELTTCYRAHGGAAAPRKAQALFGRLQ